MKPIRSSLPLLVAAAILLPLAGCGGQTDTDPQRILDTALSRESLLGPPVGPAEVEVASLGFEDAVLDRRILKIDRDTNEAVREALAGSAASTGESGNSQASGAEKQGLSLLVEDLNEEKSSELDGTGVDRVTGSIDVEGLIDQIRPLSEDQSVEPGAGEIPGLGELDKLEQSLVSADFELFADDSDGSLERFDLILAIDDPGNSLPPSRIRFSLTDAGTTGAGQPGEAQQ